MAIQVSNVTNKRKAKTFCIEFVAAELYSEKIISKIKQLLLKDYFRTHQTVGGEKLFLTILFCYATYHIATSSILQVLI